MGSPSMLRKLGDKADRFVSGVKTLPPDEGERQSIEYNQQQVNALAGHPRLAPIQEPEPQGEVIDPLAKYGDRGNEHRYQIDSRGNMTEIPMARPQHVDHYSMDVPVDSKPGLKPIVPSSLSQPMPLYDEGGDVDVNDGTHKAVIAEDGERVLTPAENDQFKKEHPEEAAAHAEPTQEATLRPYGEVKAEKDKASAPKPLSEPSTSDSTESSVQPPPPAPKKLPTASHAERVAIKVDQQNAMGKGVDGLTQLGMANIHAKQLGIGGETEDAPAGAVAGNMKAPAEFNQGAEEPKLGALGGEQSAPAAAPAAPAAPGLKPIPDAAPPVTTERTGDFKTRLKQLELDHAKALSERSAEGKVKADYIQEQINDLHKNNPWGTEGNHPGFLGKLGHVAAKVGNIAGNLVSPAAMSIIPGTELNQREQEAQLQHQTQADQAAVTADDKANKTAGGGENWKPVSGAVGPNGRVMLMNSKTNEVQEAPEGYTPYDKPAHLGDKAAYIDQWYKSHEGAPKSQENDDKALEAYGRANAAAAQENKAKGKIYYYDTDGGRRGYTYGQAKAAGFNPDEDGYSVSTQQAEKDRKADETYEGLKSQMTQYKNNMAKSVGQLLPTDVDNMASMIEAVDSPDYVSKIVTGVVDDLYGKPVTGYNEKVMKGALTKKAYDNMSPAARQLVADYFTTLLAHFGNVKATLGQVPRNEKLITTEMNMIPKPYLNSQEAEPAFSNYTAQVERNNSHNVKFGNAKSESKTQPAANTEEQDLLNSVKMPDGSKPAKVAKAANGHILVWSGKEGDPWIDPTAPATK